MAKPPPPVRRKPPPPDASRSRVRRDAPRPVPSPRKQPPAPQGRVGWSETRRLDPPGGDSVVKNPPGMPEGSYILPSGVAVIGVVHVLIGRPDDAYRAATMETACGLKDQPFRWGEGGLRATSWVRDATCAECREKIPTQKPLSRLNILGEER